MRLAVLSAFFGLSVACFTEPSADRMWRCSVEQPLCPEGQTCISDWCTKDGTATPDFATADAAEVSDMFRSPCTDGKPLGTQGVWACRGKFSPTTVKASGLCLSGYKLCTDGFKLTAAECSASTPGFFYADAPAAGSGYATAQCGSQSVFNSMFYGCGLVTGSTKTAGMPCRGLTTIGFCGALICDLSDGRLDAQQSNDALSGVLCCPP